MISKIKKYINEKNMLEYGDSVVVGLSGGADSVCLFRILVSLREEYGLILYAVHVNHGIRGGEAECDEHFSESLAEKYDVPCTVYRYDVPSLSRKWKMTEEEAGRRARYEAFEAERERRGAACIAVAHHKNDQAETILFRMCRGTGIKGMIGIPSKRDNIIRPLLCVDRKGIESYLNSVGQYYVSDSTNDNEIYDRNRMRKFIIPELEKINPSAVSHICAMSEKLSEIYDWYDGECGRLYSELVSREGNALQIRGEDLAGLKGAVASEIVRKMIGNLTESLKDIENRHIEGIRGLAVMQSGKRLHLPYSIVAEKQYGNIRLYTECMEEPENIEIDISLDKIINSRNREWILRDIYLPENMRYEEELKIRIVIKKYNREMDIVPKNSCTKWFDCDKMKDKMVFRRPRDNDYYYIGDGRRKKVSRYMIDEKIPRRYRNRLIVLAAGDNVLYIVGGRTGSGCYVDENSKDILSIDIL